MSIVVLCDSVTVTISSQPLNPHISNADAVHLSRAGIPTGLVSVPCRYMHSPVEMVSTADIDAAARLIAAFARRLEPGTSFER